MFNRKKTTKPSKILPRDLQKLVLDYVGKEKEDCFTIPRQNPEFIGDFTVSASQEEAVKVLTGTSFEVGKYVARKTHSEAAGLSVMVLASISSIPASAIAGVKTEVKGLALFAARKSREKAASEIFDADLLKEHIAHTDLDPQISPENIMKLRRALRKN